MICVQDLISNGKTECGTDPDGCSLRGGHLHCGQGLLDSDLTYIPHALELDDQIDEKEREIEALCMKILLQQQPVASDLRMVSSALKMISDMERIGDQGPGYCRDAGLCGAAPV